jgi:hypothetical protein
MLQLLMYPAPNKLASTDATKRFLRRQAPKYSFELNTVLLYRRRTLSISSIQSHCVMKRVKLWKMPGEDLADTLEHTQESRRVARDGRRVYRRKLM